MDKQMHYQMAFKQGGIQPEEAKRFIDELDESTLDQVTKMSFDRRLIKPIMEVAFKETEENPEVEFDDAVNGILKNKIRMLTFMQRFCMR